MKFWNCAVYLALIGALGFIFGRFLAKIRFDPEKGIFRSFPFEKDGRIYEKIGIDKWQSKVPDMSRIFPSLMPPKNLSGSYEERLPVMINETCVAELSHIIISIIGIPALWIFPGTGGIIVFLIFVFVLNFPFIIIQRYNRPRLVRLQKKLNERKERKKEKACVC